MKVEFPVSTEESCCGIAYIGCGGAETAYVPDEGKYGCEIVEIIVGIRVFVHREAGRDYRTGKLGLVRHVDSFTVKKCPFAFFGIEKFVGSRQIDNTNDGFTV